MFREGSFHRGYIGHNLVAVQSGWDHDAVQSSRGYGLEASLLVNTAPENHSTARIRLPEATQH
jgi:hypothetical protein